MLSSIVRSQNNADNAFDQAVGTLWNAQYMYL